MHDVVKFADGLTEEGQACFVESILKNATIEDILDGLYMEKKAKNEAENSKMRAGAVVAAGGGLYAKEQYDRGHITGRETLWHNTAKDRVDSIHTHELRKSYASDPNNLTNTVVRDVPKEKLQGKVYFGRRKLVSNAVGSTSKKISMAQAMRGKLDRAKIEELSKIYTSRQTLKAKVPTWKMKEVDNPELRGAKDWKDFKTKLKGNPLFNMYPEHMQDAQAFSGYHTLGRKGTATLENNVDAKYFKGSKSYTKASMEEIKDFIKHNPKRFVKGVGKAGLGLGVAAAGAALIGKGLKDRLKKASDMIDELFEKKAWADPVTDPNEFSPVIPQAEKAMLKGVLIGSAMQGIGSMLEVLQASGKIRIKPSIFQNIINANKMLFNPQETGITLGLMAAGKEMSHNAQIHNKNNARMNELFERNASSVVDTLYKKAKMEVPSKKEIEKEITNPTNNLEEIECENCDYKGTTTEMGLCPKCGVIGGIKPTLKLPKEEPKYFEPMHGISVTEADTLGRMGENII